MTINEKRKERKEGGKGSPRKSLLDKIHHSPHPNPLPRRSPNLIRKRPRPTNRHRHRPNPRRQDLVEDNIRPTPPGEHLHGRTGRDDLAATLGLRDEELHGKDVAAARQTQDLVHVLADPGEVVCAADGPDEVDTLGGDAALCGADDEVASEEEVVRYACACGEEHGGAVAGHVDCVGGVGAFDEAGGVEGVVWGGGGGVVEFAGHALAGGDDEGDGGGFLGVFHVFFEVVDGLFFKEGGAHWAGCGLFAGEGFGCRCGRYAAAGVNPGYGEGV